MNGSIVKAACVAVLCAGVVGQVPLFADSYGPVTISLTKTSQGEDQDTSSGTTESYVWKTQTTKIGNAQVIEWLAVAMGVPFRPGSKLMAVEVERDLTLYVYDPVLDEYTDVSEQLQFYMLAAAERGSYKYTENPVSGAYTEAWMQKGVAEFVLECGAELAGIGDLFMVGLGTYSLSNTWKGNGENETVSGSASAKATITASYEDEVITGTISYSGKALPLEWY